MSPSYQQLYLVDGQASTCVQLIYRSLISFRFFPGDVLRRTEFSDMFQASVDTQVILTDVQKFTYLKEHQRDAAAETISGLQLSSVNYRIAKAGSFARAFWECSNTTR